MHESRRQGAGQSDVIRKSVLRASIHARPDVCVWCCPASCESAPESLLGPPPRPHAGSTQLVTYHAMAPPTPLPLPFKPLAHHTRLRPGGRPLGLARSDRHACTPPPGCAFDPPTNHSLTKENDPSLEWVERAASQRGKRGSAGAARRAAGRERCQRRALLPGRLAGRPRVPGVCVCGGGG